MFPVSSPAAVQQQMRVTELEDDSHVEDTAELERQSPPFVMDGAVSSATVLELVHVNPDVLPRSEVIEFFVR